MTEEQIKNLLAQQSKDNYKTMKELNKLNERAPPTKIAKAKQNRKWSEEMYKSLKKIE